MNLKQTRLISRNVPTLTAFYEMITGAKAKVLASGYAEFQESRCAGLAIAGQGVVDVYGGDVVAFASNKSAVLDFEVEDVDAEYKRLKEGVSVWVLPPTDQPWGNRAMLFRDPDGNLVNMFAFRRDQAKA